jgi:RNA polymerase sigma-70 factor (ECF subfamily)
LKTLLRNQNRKKGYVPNWLGNRIALDLIAGERNEHAFSPANLNRNVSMSSSVTEFGIQVFAPYVQVVSQRSKEDLKSVFEENRHRIYSLAFWMTDNEVTAEEVSSRVFSRAFTSRGKLDAAAIDRYLISELREIAPIGIVTLDAPANAVKSVAGNTKRVHLERAVVQIPPTERMAFLLHDVEGYDHARIAKTLGISEDESKQAVFQAKILVRKLIAEMI